MTEINPIVKIYSEMASAYDDGPNLRSCWGKVAEKALASIYLKDRYKTVVDIGCGTGRALFGLAAQTRPDVQMIGIDPADNMRTMAIGRTRKYCQVRILEGAFENIPVVSGSADYLYSILAFHWTTDVNRSVKELSRVLKPDGEMDLFFIGRHNGKEFIRKTTPIFLKHLGPAPLLQSATLRKQLTKDAAVELFSGKFGTRCLSVEESYETYYDTVDGHWGWWVRIEGHFVNVPLEKRKECDSEVREAIQSLSTDMGIPYTIHLLRVRLRSS